MRSGRQAELKTAIAVAAIGLAVMVWPVEEVPVAPAAAAGLSMSDMIAGPLMAEGPVRPLSPEASRVALTALSMDQDLAARDAFSAMSAGRRSQVELGGGVLTVAILEPDQPSAAYAALAPAQRREAAVLIDPREPEATVAVNYALALETPGGAGELDVAVRPRAGLSMGPDGSAAGAGAEVRFGEFVDRNEDASRWYVFAAADRRALLYDPMQGTNFRDAVALTHREVVGDAQAGVAVRMGPADLSVAYVRREYRYTAGVEDFDETEDFGAVSVHWRW